MITSSAEHAAQVIQAGGVVAYPAEACFGLGCDPRNANALRRILGIKRRPSSKGLVVVSDRLGRLRHLVRGIPEECRSQVLASWPGPFTWLLPVKSHVSLLLKGDHDTLAVRIPAFSQLRLLCRLAGTPVVSTSANRSGRKILRHADQVIKEFSRDVDCILVGRIGGNRAPSVIKDSRNGRVVRG